MPTAAAAWQKHPSASARRRRRGTRSTASSQPRADALDAAADLAVAESVYQTVHGNPARAGATVDGLSGAPVPPPEIGVVRTPAHRRRRDSPARSSCWGTPAAARLGRHSPRALAEPRLEAWARATLPRAGSHRDPGPVRRRARARGRRRSTSRRSQSLHNAANAVRGTSDTDCVGALDLVLLADPHETPHRSRARAAARGARRAPAAR